MGYTVPECGVQDAGLPLDSVVEGGDDDLEETG
jgi:hypothetical protein